MAEVILITIATAWAAIIMVDWYINLAIKTRNPIRKPFGCEKCMGFWLGLLIFYFFTSENFIIFAFITSITAVLLNKLAKL